MCLKKEVYCHSSFPFIVKRRAFAPARKTYRHTGGFDRFTHNRGVSSCSVSLLKFHIQFSFYTQQCSVPLYQIPLTSAYGPLPLPVVIGPSTCKEKNTSGRKLPSNRSQTQEHAQCTRTRSRPGKFPARNFN